MASLIDKNLIVGSDEAVSETKQELIGLFDYKDCVKLEIYVRCKITQEGKHSVRFTQPVLIQSLPDNFKLTNSWYTTPVTAGDVLTKYKEEDMMEAQQQTTYQSGTGKLMHIMQYFVTKSV